MTTQVDKTKFKDHRGRPLTQSLFLEIGYNTEFAVYTLKDDDHEYEGKLYPSLKKLYLKHEDPIEYDFASTYLLGWEHWTRICENKLLRNEVDKWRNELELKLRSQAFRDILDMTAEEKSFQAAKWLADKGWIGNPVGRPKKKDLEKEEAFEQSVKNEYGADVLRLADRFKS